METQGQRQKAAVDSFEPDFHVFPQLPAELRLMIWSLSLPGPRIVSIRCGPRPAAHGATPSIQCRSPTPVPAALHACRESRAEAQRRYKLLFGMGGPDPATIYFDPLRDALYFGARDGFAGSAANLDTFMALASPADKAAVRHVALSEVLLLSSSGRRHHRLNRESPPTATATTTAQAEPERVVVERLVCEVRARFRGLRQLTLVSGGDRNPVYSADAVFVEPPQRNRLVERRVGDAVAAVAARYPSFAAPSWHVRAIAAAPGREAYTQGVLGYRGRRAAFFRSPLRAASRKRLWSSRQCACNGCGRSRTDFRLSCTKSRPYPLMQGHAMHNRVVMAGTESNEI
ncbi:hypothetical protein GGS24DRAFT_309246 [Hypoxylon argillaceum]|nr:hypothetical protein GGS24DRAFT_309246 [Hypoxylon argillaceum]